MSLKTLLSVIVDVDSARPQIEAAATLARRHDAHLDILALGIDEVQVGYYFAGADTVLQETSMAMAREAAEARRKAADDAAEAEGVRFTSQAAVAQIGVLNDVVAQAARFADLVIVPQPYGEGAPADAEAVLEAALFAGTAPTLVLPPAGLPDGFPRRAVIGWNEGTEALRAVRGALPLLRDCKTTTVAIVAPPMRGPEQGEPGQRLCTMLDRHGVRAEIALLPKAMPRIADILSRQVNDLDADLLVAGAYGHSRFREALLGGATRDLLAHATVPLLMAH